MGRKRIIDEGLLRRLESARLAGTTLKELAREHRINYADLCKVMKAWRIRWGKEREGNTLLVDRAAMDALRRRSSAG
jgi:hypothetical protein